MLLLELSEVIEKKREGGRMKGEEREGGSEKCITKNSSVSHYPAVLYCLSQIRKRDVFLRQQSKIVIFFSCE